MRSWSAAGWRPPCHRHLGEGSRHRLCLGVGRELGVVQILSGHVRAIENLQELVHREDGVRPGKHLRERRGQMMDPLINVAAKFIEKVGEIRRHGGKG